MSFSVWLQNRRELDALSDTALKSKQEDFISFFGGFRKIVKMALNNQNSLDLIQHNELLKMFHRFKCEENAASIKAEKNENNINKMDVIESPQNVSLLDIADDCILNIFRYFTQSDHISLQRSCRTMTIIGRKKQSLTQDLYFTFIHSNKNLMIEHKLPTIIKQLNSKHENDWIEAFDTLYHIDLIHELMMYIHLILPKLFNIGTKSSYDFRLEIMKWINHNIQYYPNIFIENGFYPFLKGIISMSVEHGDNDDDDYYCDHDPIITFCFNIIENLALCDAASINMLNNLGIFDFWMNNLKHNNTYFEMLSFVYQYDVWNDEKFWLYLQNTWKENESTRHDILIMIQDILQNKQKSVMLYNSGFFDFWMETLKYTDTHFTMLLFLYEYGVWNDEKFWLYAQNIWKENKNTHDGILKMIQTIIHNKPKSIKYLLECNCICNEIINKCYSSNTSNFTEKYQLSLKICKVIEKCDDVRTNRLKWIAFGIVDVLQHGIDVAMEKMEGLKDGWIDWSRFPVNPQKECLKFVCISIKIIQCYVENHADIVSKQLRMGIRMKRKILNASTVDTVIELVNSYDAIWLIHENNEIRCNGRTIYTNNEIENRLRVIDLRKELQKHGLNKNGKKQQLIDRLITHLNGVHNSK